MEGPDYQDSIPKDPMSSENTRRSDGLAKSNDNLSIDSKQSQASIDDPPNSLMRKLNLSGDANLSKISATDALTISKPTNEITPFRGRDDDYQFSDHAHLNFSVKETPTRETLDLANSNFPSGTRVNSSKGTVSFERITPSLYPPPGLSVDGRICTDSRSLDSSATKRRPSRKRGMSKTRRKSRSVVYHSLDQKQQSELLDGNNKLAVIDVRKVRPLRLSTNNMTMEQSPWSDEKTILKLRDRRDTYLRQVEQKEDDFRKIGLVSGKYLKYMHLEMPTPSNSEKSSSSQSKHRLENAVQSSVIEAEHCVRNEKNESPCQPVGTLTTTGGHSADILSSEAGNRVIKRTIPSPHQRRQSTSLVMHDHADYSAASTLVAQEGENSLTPTLINLRRSGNILKEGILLKKGRLGAWKQGWVALDEKYLYMYKKSILKPPKRMIPLTFSQCHSSVQLSAKTPGKDPKIWTFDLFTPERKYIFGASSLAEMNNWMTKIQSVCDNNMLDQLDVIDISQPLSSNKSRYSAPCASSSITKHELKDENYKCMIELLKIRDTVPGNKVCCDCSCPDPEWTSLNLGIFICIQCSGIHRSLGVQRSKVRSIAFDNWTEPAIEVFRNMGNKKANEIWEHNVSSPYKKPLVNASHQERREWVLHKYVYRTFFDQSRSSELLDSIVSVPSSDVSSSSIQNPSSAMVNIKLNPELEYLRDCILELVKEDAEFRNQLKSLIFDYDSKQL